MTQGERIKEQREEAGLSRFDAANAMTEAGCPTRESDFYRWENDRNQPGFTALRFLSQILNTSADYFLGLSDVPAPARATKTQRTPAKAVA